MKQIITLSAILALTACSESRKSLEGEMTFADSVKTSNIVGGTPVSAEEDISKTTVQIYQIHVQTDENNQIKSLGAGECTGSILANDIVLTAGHCTLTNPTLLFLYFGNDKPEVTGMEDLIKLLVSDPRARRVTGGLVPSLWPRLDNKINKKNWGDIALLKFSGGLPAGYRPATLAKTTTGINANDVVTLAGWGLVDGVLEVKSKTLRKVNVTIHDPAFSETEMLLATSKEKGSCHGDSGGPAYLKVQGQLQVVGVTSRADAETDENGECIGRTVYTKTQPYLTWINNAIKTLKMQTTKTKAIPQPW